MPLLDTFVATAIGWHVMLDTGQRFTFIRMNNQAELFLDGEKIGTLYKNELIK